MEACEGRGDGNLSAAKNLRTTDKIHSSTS